MLIAYLGFASLAGAGVCLGLLLVAAARRRPKRALLFALAACVAVCAVCMALTPPSGQAGASTPSSPSEASTPPVADAGLSTPVPTVPPVSHPVQSTPAPTPDFDAQLADYQAEVQQAALDALDGLFDAGADRSATFTPATGALLLEVQGTDNLTAALVRKGMLADIRDTLAALPLQDLVPPEAPEGAAPALGVEKVLFSVRFPLQAGQEPPIVLKATYTHADLAAVDWSHTGAVDWEALATEFWAAPALEEG